MAEVSSAPVSDAQTPALAFPVVATEQSEAAALTAAATPVSVDTGIPEVVAPCDAPPVSSDGKPNKAIKVLFLSSDTGGGHRASAQSLARQFELLFPGSTYSVVDLATEAYLPPYNSIVSYYKHLSAHPSQWKLLYGVTNSKFMERAVDTNIKVMTVMCERGIRKKIKSYGPDVVVSVHPLQTSVPILSCAKISHETGKHLPMFTVVTDLGSAHSTWFANGVERMFVGSTQIYDLAKERGKVPDDKLVLLGLPIRHDFALEAERLGDRWSQDGLEYQRSVRASLRLPAIDRKTLLVMGGGEGVGSLSKVVDALYCELVKQGIDAVICVVCGRNETLQKSLEKRDWDAVFQKYVTRKPTVMAAKRPFFPPLPSVFADLSGCGDTDISSVGCIEAGGVTKSLRRILSSGTLLSSDNNPVFIPSPAVTSNAIEEEKKDDKIANEHSRDDENEAVNGNLPKDKVSPNELSQHKRNVSFARSSSIGAIQVHDRADERSLEVTSPSDGVEEISITHSDAGTSLGMVSVVGLGFITNMAEYMVAADILVSKAGPGTISEAAALSLPVMLTSYLPGQEEGNVDYVVKGEFGAFCEDTDPQAIGEEIAQWLNDDAKLKAMSIAAKAKGAPHAARDIVQMIGDSTLKWREHNEHVTRPMTSASSPRARGVAAASNTKL
jgi:UDP-N-acetylglucosamine:LPS N-acetylglucosamine transferase